MRSVKRQSPFFTYCEFVVIWVYFNFIFHERHTFFSNYKFSMLLELRAFMNHTFSIFFRYFIWMWCRTEWNSFPNLHHWFEILRYAKIFHNFWHFLKQLFNAAFSNCSLIFFPYLFVYFYIYLIFLNREHTEYRTYSAHIVNDQFSYEQRGPFLI